MVISKQGMGAVCVGIAVLLTVGAATAAPGTVEKLTAAAVSLQATLEWDNPGDPGFAGVLVLRREGAAVADVPTDGQSYDVGDPLGASVVACKTSTGVTQCVDTGLVNGSVYHYAAFAFDGTPDYSPGSPSLATPRASSEIRWGFSTGGSALSPVGVIPQQHSVGIGNDQLLHRIDADDGTRGTWSPPQVGGSVQSRPVVGDLSFGQGAADPTAFLTAQDGVAYRFGLDDGVVTAEGSADVITDAGCTSGILQGGPVVMVDGFDSNANGDDDVVAVVTRCGTTDNKVLLYSHDLSTMHSAWDGGIDGLGIGNAAPLIIYRNTANNLLFVGVRDDGGESVAVLEVASGPSLPPTPYAQISGIGDIDARPEMVRRNVDRFVLVGNDVGALYLFSAFNRTGGPGSSLVQIDGYTEASGDGPVKGIAVGTGVAVSPGLYENWVVWSTDTLVHGVKIAANGRFENSSYWSTAISSPSLPLVLRYVGGTANTRAFVGAGDGHLYELDATSGAINRSFLIETGKTVGDPSFDYADGTTQGIVVGTTSGIFHWVDLLWGAK